MLQSFLVGLIAMCLACGGRAAVAQTPAEAYAQGCAGCHPNERSVLRKIPRGADAQRRAWIEDFMTRHPCERDTLKPMIVEYLLGRTRP